MSDSDLSFEHQDAPPNPVHLLLISDSKIGKSTYAVQAAIDGFKVIYQDSDNGLSAIQYAMKDQPQHVKDRIMYMPIKRPAKFLMYFLRSSTAAPLYWIRDKGMPWSRASINMNPDEVIWVLNIEKVPREWIISTDSWSSVSADALEIGSPEQGAALLDGTDQVIYGDAAIQLTYVCNMIQKRPEHWIVQAHGTRYEIYDKPKGKTGAEMKQKEMTLREVVDVPVSSSRGHGQTMASRFNHIGWMNVNNVGEAEIDFRRIPNRVGGGPPNILTKAKDLPFKKLVGLIPPEVSGEGWFRRTTHGELIAQLGAAAKPVSAGLLGTAKK